MNALFKPKVNEKTFNCENDTLVPKGKLNGKPTLHVEGIFYKSNVDDAKKMAGRTGGELCPLGKTNNFSVFVVEKKPEYSGMFIDANKIGGNALDIINGFIGANKASNVKRR